MLRQNQLGMISLFAVIRRQRSLAFAKFVSRANISPRKRASGSNDAREATRASLLDMVTRTARTGVPRHLVGHPRTVLCNATTR